MRITIRHKFYSKQAGKKKKKCTFFLRGSGFVYGLSNTDIQASVTFFLVSIMNREQEREKKNYEKLCTFSRGCFTVCQQKGVKGLLKKTHTVFIRRHIHRDSINEWLGHVQRFTCPCFAINKVCVMWGAVPLPLLLVLWIMQRRMWK